jgi:hypothetical protein
MKVSSVLVAVAGVGLVAATVSPPGGTRYFTQSVPPNAGIIRALSRSHLSMVADLFRIRAIATTITLKTPADGRTLIAWCDLVTELDPQFVWPYVMGGLLGPMSLGNTHYNVKEGNALLQRGVDSLPNDFRLPLYLSYNQLHLEHDFKGAAETLRRGARIPGAPMFMALLATRLLTQTNEFTAATAFADELEQGSPDPEVRAFFKRRRLEVERDRQTAAVQAVVDEYKRMRGFLPATLEQLLNESVLTALPEDPLGGTFLLDADGQVRSTSGDRLQVHFPKESF